MSPYLGAYTYEPTCGRVWSECTLLACAYACVCFCFCRMLCTCLCAWVWSWFGLALTWVIKFTLRLVYRTSVVNRSQISCGARSSLQSVDLWSFRNVFTNRWIFFWFWKTHADIEQKNLLIRISKTNLLGWETNKYKPASLAQSHLPSWGSYVSITTVQRQALHWMS